MPTAAPKRTKRKSKRQQKNLTDDEVKFGTIAELQQLYATNKEEAKLKLVRCFEAVAKESATDTSKLHENFLEDLLKGLSTWSHKQDLLVLYVRWAKKVPNHYHTDCLSVLHVLQSRQGFDRVSDVVLNRNVSYHPPTKRRKGSKYGNFICFKDSQAVVNLDENDENPTTPIMHEIAREVGLFEQMVVRNVGKVGYRRGGGNKKKKKDTTTTNNNQDHHDSTTLGPTSIHRKFSEDTVETFLTRNLLECHYPPSFAARVAIALNIFCLSFWLCRMIFPIIHDPTVFVLCCKLTQSARNKQEFLGILAGVCLLFPFITPLDENRDIMKKYKADGDGMEQLVAEANAAAKAQFVKEAEDNEIAQTIIGLNQHGTHYSFMGLYSATNDPNDKSNSVREKRYLILRAVIFQWWMESNSKLMQKFRESVLQKINGHQLQQTGDNEEEDVPPTQQVTDLAVFPPATSNNGNDDNNGIFSTLLDKFDIIYDNNDNSFLPTKNTGAVPFDLFPSANNSSEPTTVESPDEFTNLRSLIDSDEWTDMDFQLASSSDLNKKCFSALVLEKPDGSTIILHMSPQEFYSADQLYRLHHLRFTGGPQDRPNGADDTRFIKAAMKRFVDPDGFLFAVRPDDNLYKKRVKQILNNPSEQLPQLISLIEAVVSCEYHDPNRSKEPIDGEGDVSRQYRQDIQCAGLNYEEDGKPCKVAGTHFLKMVDREPRFRNKGVREILQRLCVLSWVLMDDLEKEINGLPIAPNVERNDEYARFLRAHIGIAYIFFNAECLTIVVGIISGPNYDCCTRHVDKPNDHRFGYTKTGVLNFCFVDRNKQIIIHLQIILNFRKAVGDATQPYSEAVKKIVSNIENYKEVVDFDYRKKLSRCADGNLPVPTIFDRTNFWLDDCHMYEDLNLGGGISMDVLTPMIGPSRVFSYSMFIEPIHCLRGVLAYDQLLELSFFATFQSSPFWFNHALRELTAKHLNVKDSFQFSMHPMYDVVEQMIESFGGWQCAIRKRYSPAGGADDISVPFVFGFGEHTAHRVDGEQRLAQIIGILYEFAEWIDTDLVGRGDNPIGDMPLQTIKKNQDLFLKRIKGVTSCQFAFFRLGSFTTIISGCGLLKSGAHLHHLAFPVDELASYKHLMIHKDSISPREFDAAMEMISFGLGIPYLRNYIETLLCEGLPGRSTLLYECVDWFRRGGVIFDMHLDGSTMFRPYGNEGDWTVFGAIEEKKLSFLCELSTSRISSPTTGDSTGISDTAMGGSTCASDTVRPRVFFENGCALSGIINRKIGELMRSAKFQQPKEFVKEAPGPAKFLPVSASDAIFYHGAWDSELHYANLLDDGNEVVSMEDMVELGSDFDEIFDTFGKEGFHYKMMILRTSEASDEIQIYEHHRDKVHFQKQGVAFLPLNTPFYTVLDCAVDTPDDSCMFYKWVSRLELPDVHRVAGFLHKFGVNGKHFKKWIEDVKGGRKRLTSFGDNFDRELTILFCHSQTALAFDACNIAHGTIVPSSGSERRLCILAEMSYTGPRGDQILGRKRKRKRSRRSSSNERTSNTDSLCSLPAK